ncbi:auxin-responsive protein SAUR67-like [Solanum dulcamara]|uniref:auxin-responsive protein SAUR67-like n=1 Tax=Solanum dulcamara TaxID=45834 RepID=UPI0024859C29|nr:auxin-responsive protein SAUR67-like [Solanum dulcamara]
MTNTSAATQRLSIAFYINNLPSMKFFHHQLQALSVQPSNCSKFLVYFLVSNLSSEKKKERKTMLSARKLIKMARSWQKFAAKQRRRISLPRNVSDADSCSVSSSVVEKGHFVVYTIDQRRFVIPLTYLENEAIRQLLNMSEEEFGLPSSGRITLPCDSAFMNNIVSLINKGVATDFHNAVLLSIPSCCCSTSLLHQESGTHQILVY